MLPDGTFEMIERSFNRVPDNAEIERRRNLDNLHVACLCITNSFCKPDEMATS
jgi:hypothetical protein